MFINKCMVSYGRDGQQVSCGRYLALYADGRTIYGIVRQVRLRQLGHFMMGHISVANEKLVVSGAFGADGLPRDYDSLSDRVKAALVKMPDDLADEFWKLTLGMTSGMIVWANSISKSSKGGWRMGGRR